MRAAGGVGTRWWSVDQLVVRSWPWVVVDVAVATVSAGVAVGDSDRTATLGDGPALEQAVAVVWFLSIAGRRLAPVVCLWAAAGATAAAALEALPLTNLSLATALALALVVRSRPARGAAALAAAPVLVAVTALGTTAEGQDTLVLALAVHALAVGYGRVWRSGVRSAAALEELRRTRAVEAERSRLARDLHDAVGHAVTLMLTHAGAARMSMAATAGDGPGLGLQGPVHRSLSAVEDAGRAAMHDLDRVLHLLEGPVGAGTAASAGPDQPLVDRLRALVAALPAGLEADLEHSREPQVPALTTEVADAVHRVVQEALTNVVRHAGARAVTVVVDHRRDGVAVEVRDDGSALTPQAGRSRARAGAVAPGRGLRGMAARAGALGGRVEAGPRAGGGFTVRLWLPVRGVLR